MGVWHLQIGKHFYFPEQRGYIGFHFYKRFSETEGIIAPLYVNAGKIRLAITCPFY